MKKSKILKKSVAIAMCAMMAKSQIPTGYAKYGN